MKKRLFAAFVSLCLIMSMLPTMAFAEAGVQDSGTTIGASGPVRTPHRTHRRLRLYRRDSGNPLFP